MRNLLGLFLLTFSLSVSAGNVLFLRGYVPATYRVQTKWENQEIKAQIFSNDQQNSYLPKVKIERHKDRHIVIIVQS